MSRTAPRTYVQEHQKKSMFFIERCQLYSQRASTADNIVFSIQVSRHYNGSLRFEISVQFEEISSNILQYWCPCHASVLGNGFPPN